MLMLPKFYCTNCRRFKRRWEVNIKDNTRSYWYECKWCHKPVYYTTDVVENIIDTVLG